MNIGILITSISNFGQKGIYKAQDGDLAKEKKKKTDAVSIYKLVLNEEKRKDESIAGYPNVKIHFIPAKNFGINGILRIEELDKNLNTLIHFSDTQFSVPTVYRWCKKNKVQYIPYIGVIESHSTSRIKQLITNFMFRRNIAVYKECLCCVKTPTVEDKIKGLGINQIVIAPVGLDIELLKADYKQYNSISLKEKYGYHANDKVLLFIGRLIDEKQPVKMIDILSDIRKKDQSYKLLMVGTGELKKKVEDKISEYDLAEYVQMIERIPNSEIWKLYRMAHSFVNLNQQEIFGMAILEAMYYGCKVVAWNAPGPNYIIENGISGWLVDSNENMVNKIMDTTDVATEAHQRIIVFFTWENTANRILSLVKSGLE